VFPSLTSLELDRLATDPKSKLSAIDSTRYGDAALSAPDDQTSLPDWRSKLQRAYGLHTYLSARSQHLSLLEAYGKNAWLIGNSQLEEELRSVEKELAEVKEQVENVNRQRASAQEGARGEMEGLEEAWKKGVGRMVEVQVAAENLRSSA